MSADCPQPPDARGPRLRPVEVHPDPESPGTRVIVADPSHLAGATLSLSYGAMHVLALMDGSRTLDDIAAAFRDATGQALRPGLLDDMVTHLREAHFLEGPDFEAHYAGLLRAYRDGPRVLNDVQGLGLPSADVGEGLDRLLRLERSNGRPAPVGLIAPHLDYGRGRPCYEHAYSTLPADGGPQRFVILGTNHFGRSLSAVATASDFETPLGVSRVDVDFLEDLESRCGHALREYELDHQREHSIELQVLVLQHLLGPEAFTFVPVLCPDPCGPSGTAPLDGRGVDLRDFADALGEALAADAMPTCVIAGADLSHTGMFFEPDDPQLDDSFLAETRAHDEAVLADVVRGAPQAFVDRIAAVDNPTRICSAGCIFALMTALPGARARLLDYHQAVDDELQCSVSCAAVAFDAPAAD